MQDPAKIKARKRRYYEKHRDEILARQRAYYEKNPEPHKQYAQDWRARNPERVKKLHREWLDNNKEKGKQQRAEWKKKNPDKYLDAWIKSRYGISLEEYRRLETDQGGVCAICFQVNEKNKRLAIDHDHDTGRVRGLLCERCNRALGLMKESQVILLRAAQYVAKVKA